MIIFLLQQLRRK